MPRRSIPDAEYLKVGQRIKALRVERGLSMTAFAALAGISKGHVSSIEAGYHAINTKTIATLAAALNVAPMYLLTFAVEDERQHAAELLRYLPLMDVKAIRRQLQAKLGKSG